MKKILFLLLSIYSLSFATWAKFSASQVLQLMSRQENLKFSYTGAGSYIGMDYVNSSYMLFSIYGAVYSSDRKLKDNSVGCSGSMPSENGILACVNGLFQYAPNPDHGTYDNDGNLSCSAGYSVFDNSQCWSNPDHGTYDNDGNKVCNEGYALNTDNDTCEVSSGTNTGGVNFDPNNSWQKMLDQSKADGTYSVSDSGTQNFTVGGINYSLTANGVLTTTYPDGSSSVQQVNFSDGSGGSSGGTGTSGGSGTSGGGTGNTTNENNTTPPTDTPIDNTPASNSCTDSNLTLQEKMLCELNAGMKKQNSENAPENSLNQLLKDLKTSNQTDNTALNTNIKSGNTTLTGIKALNENQLNKQTQANATLEKINDSANASELYNKVMNEDLNKLVNNTQDAEGKSYLGTITDFVKTLTTPTSDEDKSSYSSKINGVVTNSLSSSFSKYSNVLGFGSTYANRPENITMTIFNQQYTLIDFSILDSYISMIRSLFLTLAYLYGFMNLIRSSN